VQYHTKVVVLDSLLFFVHCIDFIRLLKLPAVGVTCHFRFPFRSIIDKAHLASSFRGAWPFRDFYHFHPNLNIDVVFADVFVVTMTGYGRYRCQPITTFQSILGRHIKHRMHADLAFGQNRTPSLSRAFRHRPSYFPSFDSPGSQSLAPRFLPHEEALEIALLDKQFERLEQQLISKIDSAFASHHRRLKSTVRLLRDMRSATLTPALWDECESPNARPVNDVAGWEVGCGRAKKHMTRVLWRRGEGTRVERLSTQ
jgi:hypothetical protein